MRPLPAPRVLLVALVAVGLVLGVVGGAAGAAAPAPTVVVSNVTPGLNDVEGGGFEPPDVALAAGPGFVLELVNLAARAWRTESGSPVAVWQQSLNELFAVPVNERLTDPRILYDAPSGRWLASISDVDANSVLLAVSHGTDPTAGWSVYPFVAPGCADQPRVGVADGTVVLAADIFRNCDDAVSRPLGAELWIVNKQQLLDGAATPASTTYGPDLAYESLAPVQSLSPTATEYVVAVDVPAAQAVHVLTVTGVPPDRVLVEEAATLAVAPLSPPPSAQQPASAAGRRRPALETNDDRVLDSVWENGTLSLSANTGCVPPGDTELRTCARIAQISTGTMSVDWGMNLEARGSHLFFPALRPDSAGNVVIVYGESGVTLLPQLVVVARDHDGRLSDPVVVARSAGAHEGGRYGDYFAAARDPLHPELIWVAGERGIDVKGARGWSTAVAAVRVVPAGASPPVVGVTLPRLQAHTAAGRAGGAVRLAYTALDDGAAVRSRVVVSARGSTVFSTTTLSGALVAGRSYTVVWHPARRLHGAFAWCVRSLAAGRQSAQNCSTVTLR